MRAKFTLIWPFTEQDTLLLTAWVPWIKLFSQPAGFLDVRIYQVQTCRGSHWSKSCTRSYGPITAKSAIYPSNQRAAYILPDQSQLLVHFQTHSFCLSSSCFFLFTSCTFSSAITCRASMECLRCCMSSLQGFYEWVHTTHNIATILFCPGQGQPGLMRKHCQ